MHHAKQQKTLYREPPEDGSKLCLTARFKTWYLWKPKATQRMIDQVSIFGSLAIIAAYLLSPLFSWTGEFLMEPFYLERYGAIYKNFFVRLFKQFAAPNLIGVWLDILFIYSLYFYPRGWDSIKEKVKPVFAIIFCLVIAVFSTIFALLEINRFEMDMALVKKGTFRQIVCSRYTSRVRRSSTRSGGRVIYSTYHFVYFENELDGKTIQLNIKDRRLFKLFDNRRVKKASIVYLPYTQTLLDVQLETAPPE